MIRVIIVLAIAGMVGGAAYLSWYGIGRESAGLTQSARVGSVGNSGGFGGLFFGGGRVK